MNHCLMLIAVAGCVTACDASPQYALADANIIDASSRDLSLVDLSFADLSVADASMISLMTQTPTTNWGLDAIDQYSGQDNKYEYDLTGAGVHLYVIDTGVRRTHVDFMGRNVDWVGAFCDNSPTPDQNADEYIVNDGYDGHGTHDASFAAGNLAGVAKQASIHALRAGGPETGCTGGDPTAAIRAVKWITANGQKPAVVNISFAFANDGTLNQAILDSIAAGYTYVLSGGTGDVSSRWGSQVPTQAIVVGGVDSQLNTIGSDRGPSLSLWAPAKGLYGASYSTDSGPNAYTIPEACCGNPPGDSFSAPFVSGVAALYLQAHPTASPAMVKAALVAAATVGVVGNPGTSPNLFLYSRVN